MNTATEPMQRYYDDPSLLENYELEPALLQQVYQLAYKESPTTTGFLEPSKVDKMLTTLVANPNTPTEILKELFQKSFETFLIEVYFNPYQEIKDRKKRFLDFDFDFHGSILKAIVNNPVLPLLLLENPSLAEDWLTYLYPASHRLKIVIINYLDDLTKMLEYFEIGVIIDWLLTLNID